MDCTQRFMLAETDIRGEWVDLQDAYAQMLSKHPYPSAVAILLGQLLAAAALLSSTLKFHGVLTLQARSEGPVRLIMVECSSEGAVRGLAQFESDEVPADAVLEALMPGGILAVTVLPRDGQRYQGLVSLQGDSLAHCLDAYFEQSEQLPTRFWLCAGGNRARGLLLQALPDSSHDPEKRAADWQHAQVLAASLTPDELLTLDNLTLLRRLYHQDPVRLFEPRHLHFACSCSRERSAQALRNLGQDDALELLSEQGGHISIHCEMCNQHYVFDAADVAQWFAGGGSQPPAATRH